ncbi:MAG: DUF2339 domain-containing protein [Bacteroidaceae bacterium]|nr:DUF2339 domain-containing protein [Bacteroidaceae bacterium]
MQIPEHKQSLEERVSELEAQVAELRQKVALLSGEEPETVPVEAAEMLVAEEVSVVEEEAVIDEIAPEDIVADSAVADIAPAEADPEPEIVQMETAADDFRPEEPKKEAKSLESKIGKLIIPVAGSALIIFALILFGSLIQPHLTDMMKAILMAVGSLAVTAFGVWKMKPVNRYYTLFAALAGCGSAACYITALVSHFVLGVLPELGLMACVLLWIAVMTALSRFKSRIFCYICYVGILIAAYMTVLRWDESPIGLWVYVVSVSALFMANVTRCYRRDAWLLIQYPLVMWAMSGAYDSNTLSLLVIFITTAAVLAGQIAFYSRNVVKKAIFIAPTVLSFVVLLSCAVGVGNVRVLDASSLFLEHFGQPVFSNHWAWSILLSVTLIGMCVLYLKCFRFSGSLIERVLIFIMLGFTALYVPELNFGAFYNGWCSTHLVPAVVALGIGCYYGRKEFRYLGYAYLLLYSMAYVPRLEIPYTRESLSYNLKCCTFVYWALLLGFGAWIWRRCQTTEKKILLGCYGWGIIALTIGNWVDLGCCYLLLCAYCLVLIFKVLPKLMLDEKALSRENFMILCAVLSVAVLLVRASYSLHTGLLYIPRAYGSPIIGLAASFVLFTIANAVASRNLKMLSYALLAINLCVCVDDSLSLNMMAWCLYLVGLAWFVYCTVRHYAQLDKLCLAALGLFFICMLGMMKLLNIAECWALNALFVMACGVFGFSRNPHSGEVEPLSHHICNGAHEVFLLIGTFLLVSYHEPLFLGRAIDGTETVVTVLLVVLTLMLAVVNLKRVNGLMRYFPEHLVSIYNGGKFTWALLVILWRFSAVSYLISLAGIVLAIAFIVAGFRFRFKGMRLYGLVLTMLCVGKLLFFDIVFDNAFYRPVSFLVAGILLFLISYIYFRLEKGTSTGASDDNI